MIARDGEFCAAILAGACRFGLHDEQFGSGGGSVGCSSSKTEPKRFDFDPTEAADNEFDAADRAAPLLADPVGYGIDDRDRYGHFVHVRK